MKNKKSAEEPEGYGALGVLSKREGRLEKIYDKIIKVGTLEGIGILSEFAAQELADYKAKLKEAVSKRQLYGETTNLVKRYEILNLIDKL